MTTRRIMQVEITPDEDAPELCRVLIRNPRNGEVLAMLDLERTERWLEGAV